jgi:hypothetical protein
VAGSPLFNNGGNDAYGGQALSARVATASGPSHMSFLIWVAIIGIVLPAAILGGLKMGGFSFVFRGR